MFGLNTASCKLQNLLMLKKNSVDESLQWLLFGNKKWNEKDRQTDAHMTFSTDLHHMHQQTTVAATKLCHELASSPRNRPNTPITGTFKSASLVWHHATQTELSLVLPCTNDKIMLYRIFGASMWKVYLHSYLLISSSKTTVCYWMIPFFFQVRKVRLK